jgi:hypothetical protein
VLRQKPEQKLKLNQVFAVMKRINRFSRRIVFQRKILSTV